MVKELRAPLDASVLKAALLHPRGQYTAVQVSEQSASTNADLTAELSARFSQIADLTVLTTDYQSAGKGRLDRVWQTPPLSSVALSIVLKPRDASGMPLPTQSYGWITLIAALSLCQIVNEDMLAQDAGASASIKWPNDVLIDGRKLSGILVQLVADPRGGPPALVLGIGINVSQEPPELPLETAISLRMAGADTLDRNALIVAYLERFASNYRDLCAQSGKVSEALRAQVRSQMGTLGQHVRAILPGAQDLTGVAEDLDEYGALQIRDEHGQLHTINAADIVHLRPQLERESREAAGRT